MAVNGNATAISLNSLSTDFLEIVLSEQFPRDKAMDFVRNATPLAHAITILYLANIFLLYQWMAPRKAFELKWPLRSWNILLAAFSMAGFLGVFPEFWHTIGHQGFSASFCNAGRYSYDRSGYWAFLFTMSKVYEFGDTLFILLRKRPLLFLHYYHHSSAVIFSFFVYTQPVGGLRWGIFLNYMIHSILYSYYTCCSFALRCPQFVAKSITILQNVQFLIANSILLWMANLRYIQGVDCELPTGVYLSAQLLFASFQILFIQFFLKRYKQQPFSLSS